jgi:hypothetical protein
MANAKSTGILVTGDIVRDIYVCEGDRILPAQKGKVAPHVLDCFGGAQGLYDLIHAVRPDTALGLGKPRNLLKKLKAVHVLWSAFEGGTKKDHENAAKDVKIPKVWRVNRPLGYGLGRARLDLLKKSEDADVCHAVLVIDDAGLTFRLSPVKAAWPCGVARDEEGPQPDWVIHKMASPIAQGDLWRTLIRRDGDHQEPARRENLIVIVAADELRRAGAAISRGFSWERTLSELCAELSQNPLFQPLLRFSSRLVVNFGCVGAVWFGESCDPDDLDTAAHSRASLVYDPSLPEGGWKTCLEDDHAVYGHLNVFTAAVALAAASTQDGEAPDLDDAIRRGLAACRQHRLAGHGLVSADKPGPALDELAQLLAPIPTKPDVGRAMLDKVAPNGFEVIPTPCCGIAPADAAYWTLAAIAENPADKPQLPLYGLAHRVALYGEPSLRHIPHAHFGKLLSIDRQEIETLRSLTQLIQRYEDKKHSEQPLSIAAFGPPGAGKSFGIKEIARQVLGEDVPILEFNLSQFDDPGDLFGAFHQVRDQVLAGVTPVVFWDEFDSREYRWLQYLLAPMQDGTFEENGLTHTIGKCLFVFAGATSWDFEHFGPAPMPEDWQPDLLAHELEHGACAPENEPPESDSPAGQLRRYYRQYHERVDVERRANDDFRRKKGPDFLSRLDGHINVLGPNQRLDYDWLARTWRDPDPRDITFPVRRAILLRQFLGAKKPEDLLAIDRGLLRAFLYVPRYRHGARSLEKIARPLALSNTPFRRAHLPPPQVLAQHLVSAEEFDCVNQEVERLLTPCAVEALASAINDGYNHDNPAPWNKRYAELDAFLQQSNRAAALRVPHVLALAGLRLTPRDSQDPSLDFDAPLTGDENAILAHLEKHVEVLAEEEHRLWMLFHEENGWTFGCRLATQVDSNDPAKTVTTFEKDKDKLEHPCMAPFRDMPDDHGQRETWQDYDRNAVLRYPRLLRLTDFMITFTAASGVGGTR